MNVPEPIPAAQLLYLTAEQGKTLVAYRIDDATGKLAERFQLDLPGNPGPIAFSPDRSFVYVALTGLPENQAGVATFRRDHDGALSLIHTATIASRAPYIRTGHAGRYLLAAHYHAGEVTMYRIVDGVCTGELLDRRQTEKTAHCIELDPSGRFAFVPHTAPNRVYQFRLDDALHRLVPNDPPFVDGPDPGHAYHEPRHYLHHPRLDLGYTSNENCGGITRWQFDPARGTLARLETLSTLPLDYEGDSAAADLRLTPDARFVYVSNRDLTDRGSEANMRDTIAGFALDEEGRMRPIGHFPTAYFPRSMCIDLAGRCLYAAGQRSSTLWCYRIDRATGRLHHVDTYPTGEAPIWVTCGPVSE